MITKVKLVPVNVKELDYQLIMGRPYYLKGNAGEDSYTLYELSYNLREAYPDGVDIIPEIYEEKNEYKELLYVINNPNNSPDEPLYYRIPADEPVYEINLNTRTVQTPEFLSVLEDHNAEVVWFKVDRFFDDVDLFNSTCWIQYKNALNEEYIARTTPQVIEEYNHDVLYIPWAINGAVARAAGNVTFSFQFFKMGDSRNVYFSIHTRPATSKILHGLHVNPVDFIVGGDGEVKDETDIGWEWWNDPSIPEQQRNFLYDYVILSNKYNELSGAYNLYWVDDEK